MKEVIIIVKTTPQKQLTNNILRVLLSNK